MSKHIWLVALLFLTTTACSEDARSSEAQGPPPGDEPREDARTPDGEVGATPDAAIPDAIPDANTPTEPAPDAEVPPEGLEPLTACEVLDGEHADARCAGDDCPIARDVVLRCDDWEFAYFGLRVAATAEGAALTTTSGERSFLLEAGDGDSELSALPLEDPRQTVQLVQSADGTLFFASNTRRTVVNEVGQSSEQTSFTIVHREDGSWVEEITNSAREIAGFHTVGFEIDSSSAKHVWFENYEEPFVWAKQTPPASYEYTYIEADTVDEFPRWTLTPKDELVALSMTLVDWEGQLHATIGGTKSPLGHAWMYPHFVPYRAASPAVGLDPAAEPPSVVALLQRPDGLELAWLDAEGESSSFIVPETAPLVPTCEPDWSADDCGPDCAMSGASITGDVFAIALGRDGRAWLAWIEEQVDRVNQYSRPCEGNNLECMCQAEVMDATLHTLHVASFDFTTASLTDVLQLPVPAVATGSVGWAGEDARWLDLRAFEDKLAVGVALTRPSSLPDVEKDVRLIQLELADL